MKKTLSGNQIVVLVVALCAALVLTPVGVYAASITKVRLVDASAASRAVKVSSSGRVLSDVKGTVTATGTLSARPAAPTQPLHREGSGDAATYSFAGPAIPQGKNIAIGSLHFMGNNAGGWTQVSFIKAQPNGACVAPGTSTMTIANAYLSGSQNLSFEFPVPLVQPATDRAMCILVNAAAGYQLIVDGFLY